MILLVKAGADPNTRAGYGDTLLIIAADVDLGAEVVRQLGLGGRGGGPE